MGISGLNFNRTLCWKAFGLTLWLTRANPKKLLQKAPAVKYALLGKLGLNVLLTRILQRMQTWQPQSIVKIPTTLRNQKVNNYLYPNPAKNYFFVELAKQPKPNTTIEIYNLLGSKVRSIAVRSNKVEINVSDLKSGIYLYTISENGHSIETKKLVVKN